MSTNPNRIRRDVPAEIEHDDERGAPVLQPAPVVVDRSAIASVAIEEAKKQRTEALHRAALELMAAGKFSRAAGDDEDTRRDIGHTSMIVGSLLKRVAE